MTDLKTCGREGCCPVEQIRGELKQGEYYDVIANNAPGAHSGRVLDAEQYGIPLRDGEDIGDRNPAHCVEIGPHNENDFRICCKTCGKASPWGTQDIPGMPGAGADWTRKKWNDAVA